jgi:hypothetical protein
LIGRGINQAITARAAEHEDLNRSSQKHATALIKRGSCRFSTAPNAPNKTSPVLLSEWSFPVRPTSDAKNQLVDERMLHP